MIRINLLASLFQAPNLDPPEDDYTKLPRHADKPPSDHIRKNDLFGQRWEHYLERTTPRERKLLQQARPMLYAAGFQQIPTTNWKTRFRLLRYQGLATVGFKLVYMALQQVAQQGRDHETEPICRGNLPLAKAFLWLYTDFTTRKSQPEVDQVIRWCQQLDSYCDADLDGMASATSDLLYGKPKGFRRTDRLLDFDDSSKLLGFESIMASLRDDNDDKK